MYRKCAEAGIWLGLFVALWLSSVSVFADWPQFLGSERNGVASEAKGLPRSWPAEGPKLLWKIPVGVGFAGPAIYGDSVLLLDREDNSRDVLRRIRLTNGEEVWRFAYDAPGKLSHNGSRTTPATDGNLVFAIGPFGHIHAVSFSKGKLVWKANLLKDWGARRPNWGVAASPLMTDNSVVVTPWGRKAAVVAYNKTNGKVIWTTPNPRRVPLDYSSPVPMALGRRKMIVASGKNGYTIGVDANTGKQLWTYNGYKCDIHVPSPTILDDGRIFITGGYGAGSVMIKVEDADGGYRVKELWRLPIGSTLVQPMIYKGRIYLNKGFKGRIHGMACVTLDGGVKWDTDRSPSFDMGNIILADGLIFIINGGNGELAMVEPNPEGYKELGRTHFLKGREAWAPMAYSDGKLVLRDQTTLACLDLMAREK